MAVMLKRKHMKKRRPWFCILSLFLLLILPVYGTGENKTFHLTIFHSNDFHGYEPANLARQATIINEARGKNANVLFVNAGDVFTRGKYQRLFYGELEFAELNAMGLDALTLGNNEFKATGEAETAQRCLYARIRQAKFPVLCANVRRGKDRSYLPGVKPFTVKRIGGVRIGIFGVTANRSGSYRQTQGLIVEDQMETARKVYPQVAAQSDIVIALTHIGFKMDRELAEAVPQIAVIIGGDSHTVLRKPAIVNGIPIVQAGGEFRQYLGRLDLTFNLVENKWKLKDYKGILIPMHRLMEEDPEIKAIMDGFLVRTRKSAA